MGSKALERPVTGLLEAMCCALWGFAPRMIPHIVMRMGPAAALLWFATNMPRYLRTMRVLGPVRVHLAVVAISLYNGCTYCSFGHAYALELLYLRRYGRLFPVDARVLARWVDLPSRELRTRLRRLLQDAGLHGETLWVDRTLALASGEQRPVDGEEARIAHLVRMIGRMNQIANEAGIEPDEAQNPINKNTELKAHHAKLRTAAT